MTRALRSDRRGIGALYGTFAVLVVATLVVGILLAAAPSSHSTSASPAQGKVSDLFLETILASSEGTGPTSVQEALAVLCLANPCEAGGTPRPSMSNNISKMAGPLAMSLDRRWSFTVSNATSPVFSVGDLPLDQPATASRADIRHTPSRGYLTATVRLAPL